MVQGGTSGDGIATGGAAANTTDPDYASPAGVGGTANTVTGAGTAGNIGRIVLKYTVV
jgi:hypothetical protein